MKIIPFGKIEHKTVVIDAVFSQSNQFNSVDIMRYIAENEIQGQTFDHHDIGFYLDELMSKGMIKRTTVQLSEFTTYEVVKSH